MSDYAELVAASNFSFLRGASHPEEMIIQAKSLGLRALALCDRNSLAGVVRAHGQAKKERIRFIPGCRLVLMNGIEIACLPTDRTAYGRLCRLLTAGNRRAPKAKCFLWLEDLLRYGEGQILIALPTADLEQSSCFADALGRLTAAFHGMVYLGAAPRFDGLDVRRRLMLADLAARKGVPLVAVGDCLYHHSERRALQDVTSCIREKCTLEAAGFLVEANAARHLRPPQDMLRLFRGQEDAVARSVEIAHRCCFSLDELTYEYPDEPYDPFGSPQEALIAHTWQGAARHYPDGVPERIKNQIEHELELIAKLDYARYFLTVFDLVLFARGKGILCQG
ncbi:MAG TPA: PHP domain-containing protein, partial [Hyphomicrobiales bacterium]